MKYEKEVDEILASMHEPWMSQKEKDEFDHLLLSSTGLTKQDISDKIQQGVDMGYSVEYQVEKSKEMLRHGI